jgi:hypothetical protein
MWKIAIAKRSLIGLTLGAAFLSAAPISLSWSPASAPSLSLNRADARIGHPLTPGSIAGVNRRVNRRMARRGYYGGGYYGGGAVAAGAVGAAAIAGSNSGYNGLYSYAPPVTNTAATSTDSTTTSGTQFTVHNSPELYAACLERTFGACPGQ